MASIDDLYLARWHLVNATIPWNPSFGIPTFWRQHSELGSPIGTEQDLGDGTIGQSFTGGIVIWDPQNGARISTE